ncbi:PEP/pyruvate-binding domain-containing protein [Fundidesulfovibrio terrae]|uniref:PEP/pyruvate-binding domain-containing protein n=1 Tax=Fundidesulfovibrio terrae TaxID=2922866 RepID=UPI0024354C89|nr:PEP/pyruvate-binding domain-containing protein [Fundidesulfovibrio terrae]
MAGFFARLMARWRESRERRKGDALRFIKARYHMFRILLADNERALEAMADVDRLLVENEQARLEARLSELCAVVLELADGLNRLTGNAYDGLYSRLDILEGSLEEALDRFRNSPRGVWLPLREVTADQREQAGGKAQPLGTLIRAGLPVPDGVVVTRRACRDYLRHARLDDRLKALARDASADGADLDALAGRARAMVEASVPSPEFTAHLAAAWEHLSQNTAHDAPLAISVRSSASGEDGGVHSFAGQYASVLNVRSFAAFIEAFKEVLASAFSARALAYRVRAGMALQAVDMAVLCQRMVDARASGVLFTADPMDPASGRMLLTAVYGLGTQAVSGRSPADVFRPSRDLLPATPDNTPVQIAGKTVREVPGHDGGLRLEDVPGSQSLEQVLSFEDVSRLRDHGLRIEALAGCPQDIEWAVDSGGTLWILQARPARLSQTVRPDTGPSGQVILEGGHGASPGKAAGQVAIARSRQDLAALAHVPGPMVLTLHQSLVDAASLVPGAAGLLVDMGNPLDHLACLSRELGIPMITGLGTATTALESGQWVLVDADRGAVCATDADLWRNASSGSARSAVTGRSAPQAPDAAASVRSLVLPLNLTDAYGPTFSILECSSLHDMVRFIHEKAVIALFEAGDAVAEEAFALVRRIKDTTGLDFLIIDMGGGLVPGRSTEIGLEAVLCEPLKALCAGMAVPGLRWGVAPPIPGVGGLMSRSLLDARSERPVGNPNYAFVARDYLNLNARVDYHFAMIDAVCGANARENSIRFRFKGGGTARIQRERRAAFVEMVMRQEEFYTNRQGDMVTAVLMEGSRESIRAKMEMLGRFLGFSRLLDAAMVDDDMPARIAQAFLEGDYQLKGLEEKGGE